MARIEERHYKDCTAIIFLKLFNFLNKWGKQMEKSSY